MTYQLTYVVLLLLACSKDPTTSTSINRFEQAMDRHAAQLSEADLHLKNLDSDWDDVRQRYLDAEARYRSTRVILDEVSRKYERANERLLEASHSAEEAENRWRLFAQLVVAAAMIDAANIEVTQAARNRPSVAERPVSCSTGLSTAAYRTMLMASGVTLDGMDIDHIVPRSLGGADHPDNYQVLPASLNRSMGATWDEGKCRAVGVERCAKAIAASRRCGTLRGIGF